MTTAPWAESPASGGSNVDLPRADEIDEELKRRAAQLDEALKELRDSCTREEQAKADHEFEYAKAHMMTDAEKTVGLRESEAKLATKLSRRELATAAGLAKSARAALEVRQCQLTAAQTRAKLLIEQVRMDGSRTR